MNKSSLLAFGACVLTLATAEPVFALSNPLVVDLRTADGAHPTGTATIFGSGSSVLVNVTTQGALPPSAAVTLNEGDCAHPGGIAFALSGLEDHQSMTQLRHPLSDVAGKAKSMVVHKTSNQRSPAIACGAVSD